MHRVILASTLAAAPLGAQQPRTVTAALDSVRIQNEWTLAQQTSICEIAAPSTTPSCATRSCTGRGSHHPAGRYPAGGAGALAA